LLLQFIIFAIFVILNFLVLSILVVLPIFVIILFSAFLEEQLKSEKQRKLHYHNYISKNQKECQKSEIEKTKI
jgi:hypothetical protein